MQLEWKDADRTVIAAREGNHTDIIEPGHPDWLRLSTRDDIAPYVAPPEPTPAEILAAERGRMIASRRQIRLALGEAGCNAMDALADDLAYPWAMREQMESAHEWHRTAPEMDEFGWVMGLSPEQIDALFVRAMAL